jgi:hypothetical protein
MPSSASASGAPADVPPPEPAKLLAFWLEWERGQTPPGQTLSNLKKGGMRELLEATVAALPLEASPLETPPLETPPLETPPLETPPLDTENTGGPAAE